MPVAFSAAFPPHAAIRNEGLWDENETTGESGELV